MSELKVFSSDAAGIQWEERFNKVNNMSCYRKLFYEDDETGMSVRLQVYPRGFTTKWHRHTCGHGIYVLDGILQTSSGNFGPGSFVWWPAGVVTEHGATQFADVTVVFITNGKFEIEYVSGPEVDNSGSQMISTDVNAMQYKECPCDHNGMSDFGKYFFNDTDTGVSVKLNTYPKGWMTNWHTHNCSHGIFMLDGILKTSTGTFGPGSFIWWPEGIVAEHGATEFTDATFLFITNKKFDLTWVDEPQK